MMFMDRTDAGRQLGAKLVKYSGQANTIVLGIPRGGIVVAFEVATALGLPLDIFLSRKLGVPGHEELAFGAVAAGDGRFLDFRLIRAARISPEQIEHITKQTRRALDERATKYRHGRNAPELRNRTVILVDDGIATGASMFAAVRSLREMKLAKLVVAAPVAPRSAYALLGPEVDELVILAAPVDFYAVGQFYAKFDQTSDDEVTALLNRRAEHIESAGPSVPPKPGDYGNLQERQVALPLDGQALFGTLSIPAHPTGIVLFAHGSGSSHHSPRNIQVARALQKRGLATLLFDLLTPREEEFDRHTAQYRFDIPLLAKRLMRATRWTIENCETRELPIGYFGASTGAAAALIAAAHYPETVRAVVSRGGRPDLAKTDLPKVRAATLLIVGGNDPEVIELNREALRYLRSPHKRLDVVPGATHLFEEPGAIERVADLAGSWLLEHMSALQDLQTM